MVKNILMALSLLMTKTPVTYVTVTEGRSSAPRYPVMEIAATPTNHPDNAVENVNVCKVKLKHNAHIPGLGSLILNFVSSSFPWLHNDEINLYLIGCFYNTAVLTNGQSIPDPGNLCSECTCQVASTHTNTFTYTVLLVNLFR